MFSLEVSCSGGMYPFSLFVLYGLSVKKAYTVTKGGFAGVLPLIQRHRQMEAVCTMHPRFDGVFLSDSWQPLGLPASFRMCPWVIFSFREFRPPEKLEMANLLSDEPTTNSIMPKFPSPWSELASFSSVALTSFFALVELASLYIA
ncbi:hypothetical protein F2Q70_00001355 [Brassica cretica]|uniref:Uncharacterized protein n=1 Tax=Brassica cretica TaxID=69181 RepID=A0A8S9IXA2_BRACR|nr:hypothetical protein F2Q68_00019490 [Brassica cretica]KAF2574328.1 hypothetical protein F2Q70_00001355 [Brassica cretica]